MQTYLLINWAGLNIGDDLLEAAVHEEILDDEDTGIYIASNFQNESVDTKCDIIDWIPIFGVGTNWQATRKFIQALRQCDGVIVGGGDVIRPSFSSVVPILCSAILDKPIYMISVGVVGLKSIWWRSLFKLAFRTTEFIYVRDKKSLDIVSDLLPNATVDLVAPDIVFSHGETSDENGGDKILVNLRRVDSSEYYDIDETFVSDLAKDIMPVCEKKDLSEIVLVPFVDDEAVKVTGNPRSSDLHILSEFEAELEKLSPDNIQVTLLKSRPSINELDKLYENVAISIGMRYHFIIYSILRNKDTIAIPYAPKVDRLSNWLPGLKKKRYGLGNIKPMNLHKDLENPSDEDIIDTMKLVNLSQEAIKRTNNEIRLERKTNQPIYIKLLSMIVLIFVVLVKNILNRI